MIHKLIFFN